MKKFIKITAIAGLILTILGFGTAWAAKAGGGYWSRQEIGNHSITIPGVWEHHEHEERYRVDPDENTVKITDDSTVKITGDNGKNQMRITPDETAGSMKNGETKHFPLVRELEIELGWGNLVIKTGDGEEILVTCDFESTLSNPIRYEQEEEELKLRIGGKSKTGPEVEVTIPKDYRFYSVDIDMAAGSCDILELLADEFCVDMAAGSLTVRNGQVAEADFQCAAGNMEYSGLISAEAEADCVAGKIYLSLNQELEDFNYHAEGTGGEILIGDLSLTGLAFEKKINHQAPRQMELECAGGQIEVEFSGNDG